MDTDRRFELFDTEDPCHSVLARVMDSIIRPSGAVHGTGIHKYMSVEGADYEAVASLLADPQAVVPLFDELVRDRTMGCRGITLADGYRDFPTYLHPFLGTGTLVRNYRVSGSTQNDTGRLLAIAFQLDGQILTVNEPHGRHWINLHDGVRDTK